MSGGSATPSAASATPRRTIHTEAASAVESEREVRAFALHSASHADPRRYDAWLSRVCDEGLIIVATPYELDTNHSELAAAAAACKTRALTAVLSREGYSPFLPIFAVGHSLGSKLHVLLGCDESASGDGEGEVAGASEAVRRPPAYAVRTDHLRPVPPMAVPRHNSLRHSFSTALGMRVVAGGGGYPNPCLYPGSKFPLHHQETVSGETVYRGAAP